ncbi:MAG TPA: hypothetical protein VKK61_06310, partial [Tepidisphaeraceae bacterium]|nr:hypothetical protein [Tepidisphaeraceae bacterium]
LPPQPIGNEATLDVLGVDHNQWDQKFGSCMRLHGNLSVPDTAGMNMQVVVHFFWQTPDGRLGEPVGSKDAAFADVHWDAATSAPLIPIPQGGAKLGWRVQIPYDVMLLPTGQYVQVMTPYGPQWQYKPATSHLAAVAQLFIDGFGVKASAPIRFYVTQ